MAQHGHWYSPTWRSWWGMRARCLFASATNYKRYGGAGIKVCDRWQDSFVNFLEDMGERPEGKTLDRLDAKGDYEPDNCRWATYSEQNRHRRHEIEFEGVVHSIREWAALVGVKERTLWMRLFRHGWTVEEALMTPTRSGGYRVR